ncbi:MAG TPA: hypothetical protein VNI20_01795 [Fimbriimonadaceae bacterium]|nr:hypothetical protein [Fimbriimonadaceae bacterium]
MSGAPFVIWFLVALVFVVLAAFFVTSLRLRDLRREIKGLSKGLDTLNSRLDDQERRLEQVQASLNNAPDDTFKAIFDAVKKARGKGWLPVLSFVATRIFRAYLTKRRQRSLPRKDLSEK